MKPNCPRIHLPAWAVILGVVCGAVSARAQDARSVAALRALENEPTVQDVQRHALSYYNLEPESVKEMRSRAALKGLAPVLEASGGYTESDLNESTYLDEYQPIGNGIPWVVRGAGGNAFNVGGKITWDFRMLVFNPEELDVASLTGLIEGIVKEATRLYYLRRRLQVDMILAPPGDLATSMSKELRMQELTAMLDAMTGSWFSDEINRRGAGADSGPRGLSQPAAIPGAPATQVAPVLPPGTELAPQKE